MISKYFMFGDFDSIICLVNLNALFNVKLICIHAWFVTYLCVYHYMRIGSSLEVILEFVDWMGP